MAKKQVQKKLFSDAEIKTKSIRINNQLWLDAKSEVVRGGKTMEGLIGDLLSRWLEKDLKAFADILLIK